MQRKPIQQIITYVLGMALFLCMGMNVDSSNINDADAATTFDSPVKQVMTSPPADFSMLSGFESLTLAPPAQKSPEPAAAGAAKYEATAYYLNVREFAHHTAKIIDVVKKGTILEAIDTTNNGWLKLRSGGYVHGGYVKKIVEVPKKEEQVRTLSAPAVEKPVKPTSDVTSVSGLKNYHISEILKGTALSGHDLENAILEVEDEFGINAYFTIAVMKLESGNGKSRLARNKNNLFGLNAIDGDQYNKAYSFKTKGDCVRKFGEIISAYYIEQGYTSIEKVAGKYCEANPKWASLVKSIMKSDYSKLSV